MKSMRSVSLAGLMSCFLLSLSATALAEGEPCWNDIDCPGGGAVCGGDVCNWSKHNPNGTSEKPYYCNPAGTQAKGADGWCTADSDCKCNGQGAVCTGIYCSFTKASDAPTPPAGGSGAGGSGAGGSAAGGSSAGGSAAAGTPSTGGSTSVAGTTSIAGTAPAPAPAPAAESGGCSVSMPGNTGAGALLALGAAGLGLALARRRR